MSVSNIALSGLAAAQKDMNTTSNNISNAATYGFKESRAEFADVYSSSLFSNEKTTTGGGVQTTVIAQQFHEGSSLYTNNPMDLRISGGGYFAVANDVFSPDLNYLTRNGAFHLNKDNYIVNSEGQYLLGYQVDKLSNQVISYEPKALAVPDKYGQPRATVDVTASLNLPAGAKAMDPSLFDYTNPKTYTKSTSITTYDSLGEAYKLSTYYVKSNTAPNSYAVFYTMTDKASEKPVNIAGGDVTSAKGQIGHSMVFDADGAIVSVNGNNPVKTVALGGTGAGLDLNGGDENQTITINFDDPTQYSAPFEIRKFTQDGATSGYLGKVDIDSKGSILATYSNGESVPLGRISLVRVSSEQGLSQVGNTQWSTSQRSGSAIWGEAMVGPFGKIKSGMVEQSNVDMTRELVDLITAQRNFQANSRSLEVGNQMNQTILQIR